MTPIIQMDTKKQLPKTAIPATAITALEQFDVDMQNMPAVKTFPPQKNFMWNVEPASTQTPSSSVYFSSIPVHIYVTVMLNNQLEQPAPRHYLSKRTKWRSMEYRHAYMEAAIEQGIAWQIKFNRERRSLSQSALADMIGSHQSAISRIEDPSYGRHSLDTLVKIANAFDCALQVRLIPYSKLAQDSGDLSPASLYAAPYSEELTQ